MEVGLASKPGCLLIGIHLDAAQQSLTLIFVFHSRFKLSEMNHDLRF